MADEIVAALDEALAAGARAVLMTGAGRAFCSGADLAGGRDRSSGVGGGDGAKASLDGHYNPMMKKFAELPVPLVTAVKGPAAGIGCSMALAGDFVLVGESGYFLQAFVNIGLVPDGGASWTLPRLIGKARAFEMMMLGEKIPAAKAAEWGMVYKTVSDDALLDEACALAAKLAKAPTLALGLMRRTAAENLDRDFGAALDAEANAQREAGNSQDAVIGAVAFLKKEKAVFTGK
jgi:2-(1,2-epoxy-1,2-dihydrophenyl)acetyl-CoA isomerase